MKTIKAIQNKTSRNRWLWVTLYVLYIVFILLSATAFYAEQSLDSRASGIYKYSLTFDNDGVYSHYTLTRTTGSEPGKIFVTFNADSHTLDVETVNIRKLTIDCRSIAAEKTEEILGLDYEENKNEYKRYFIEKGKEFTVFVDADHTIDLTLEDVPYPSRVTLNGQLLSEGTGKNYTYKDGEIKTRVPSGESDVRIYFKDTSVSLMAYFVTDNKNFYHSPNTIINFDATGSIGNIVDYLWDFGDGSYGTGSTTRHSYTEDGDYEVILVIRDHDGEIKRISNTIFVSDSDRDNLPDNWELQNFGSLLEIGNGDYDKDKLKNIEEYNHNTDPTDQDTDGDGATDKEEVVGGTDPLNPIEKPEKKEKEDTSMFGLGRVAGIDLFAIILIVIIIILIIIIFGVIIRKSGKAEEEEEEEEDVEEIIAEKEEGLDEVDEEVERAEKEEEIYECPECGSQVREDQPLCDTCGATLEWEDEPEGAETSRSRQGKSGRGMPSQAAKEPIEEEFEAETEIVEEFECPTCGATVSEEDNLCPTCGEEFE